MIDSASRPVHYISPSVLPSRSANSVHVVRQVRALADSGASVTLYACRSIEREANLPGAVWAQYGVSTTGIRLLTVFAPSGTAINVRIALMALRVLTFAREHPIVISRNLYAAFLLGVIARRPLVFEAHEIEDGVRGWIQRRIFRADTVRIVAISTRLLELLSAAHGVVPRGARVLHDAAPSGIVPVSPPLRRGRLLNLIPAAAGNWQAVCGYFGHLYPGRGIEMLQAMAKERPSVLFLIVGGLDQDIRERRSGNSLSNVVFAGHLPHHQALECAGCVDVLLMPYQASVSLGVAGRDTAQWMSPMKMFEYMATGVPLMSSDLPVLREVLRNEENALLVTASDAGAWIAGLDRLLSDADLAGRISANARAAYLAKHTWDQRARELLAL